MLELLAHLEAGLDFVEEDIEFISQDQLHQVAVVAKQLEEILGQLSSRLVQSNHVRILLRGLPNVGKSSLLNALVGEKVALVSEVAGTTRDYVTRYWSIDGIDCTLIDTAGIELSGDQLSEIESEAQGMTSRQSETANVEILCIDGSRELDAWEIEQLRQTSVGTRVVVCTKKDVPEFAFIRLLTWLLIP